MRKQKGFTLIELLVVISVMGMLAAMILVSLNSVRSKGRDAKRVADLAQIVKVLELYYDANNRYPAYSDPDSVGNFMYMIQELVGANYLAQADADGTGFYLIPKAQASYPAVSDKYQDPNWQGGLGSSSYYFKSSTNPPNQGYRLRAQLENLSHPALQNGISGPFLGAATTGSTACDKSLGYYCLGIGSYTP